MPPKLSQEEIVTLKVLNSKGQTNAQVAKTLGVTEGAVRYHLRRERDGETDGRGNKPFKAESVAGVIKRWHEDHEERAPTRPVNIKGLYSYLVETYDYQGSYMSVLRYVRAHYPKPKIRPFRRVETPPGAQAQVDWIEVSGVDLWDGPQTVYGFLMTLSHSRKTVLIWSLRMHELAWLSCHREAFRRLGGIPAVCRIDNLKTGVSHGAGPWGTINAEYAAFAKALRFHVNPCLPRSPEDKGKVENKAGVFQRHLDLPGRRFDGLAGLQAYSDEDMEAWDRDHICPATGFSIEESFRAEKSFLQPLPILPEPFDVVTSRKVHKDCTVYFENHIYSVPFRHVKRVVEIRGCVHTVQVFYDGELIAEHPRGTKHKLVIDPSHYEGEGDERVIPPVPLGKLGRRLQEIVLMPVETRPLDLYAALTDVM